MEGYGSVGRKEGQVQETLQRSFMGMIRWLDGSKWERWRSPGDSHDSCFDDWTDGGTLTKKGSPGKGGFWKNDEELWSLVLSVKYL